MSAYHFEPNWDTQAVLVEEMQRMAKRIEELEGMAVINVAITAAPVAWLTEAVWGTDVALEKPDFGKSEYKMPPKVTALYAAPQPAQEPIAWLRVIDEAMVVHHCGVADPTDDYETAKRKMNSLLCIAEDIGKYFESKRHREWVGLTDAEVGDALIDLPVLGNGYFLRISRAIEDKLKEKNEMS